MPIPQLSRTYGKIGQNSNNNTPFQRPRWPFFHFRFRKEWIKPAIWLMVALVFVGFIGGTIAVAIISRDLPDPNRLTDRQVAQSTKIYDRTGTHLLYEVYQDQKRTLVNLDQIAPLAVKAVIAIEDKNFYNHSGISPLSIIRAGINNLIGRKSGSGGASTITQQLIKNTIIGDAHSYFRKLKEAILALRLEKKYTKDEILKMYLNEVPYGSTNYGIESAAQSYFHKNAKDLSLAESATLAAIIQAPSRYLNDSITLRKRRDTVLALMAEQGYITIDEKIAAQNETLKILRTGGIMDAPHFVLYVKQLLADKIGEREVDAGGLKVITTLDYDKQKIAEAAVKELGDKFAKEANANNAALVAIDPKTGQVLSMVGSRDFFNEEIDGQFNVATLGFRQPGSSFKPFVYTAAFELGYTPDTVLYDVKTNFDMRDGGDYTPKNYDGKEHGLVTMRKALQGSLNIPAVKTLYLVGVKDAIEFGKRFGYSSLSENAGLSMVLGGSEVNLLEHTDAYATLANNGAYHEPVSILKVTNPKDDVVFEWKPNEGTEAIKPEMAATIASVLSDDAARAFVFGRGSTLVLPGRPVAAKTGTTNNNKDAWTLGYTPSLAAGVWVGNTTPAPMKGGGNTLAGRIWNRFMSESLKGTPVEQFPTPPANDTAKPVLRGADGGIKLMINRLNGKIATPSTAPGVQEERTFLPSHDILQYVVRRDPRGPIPADPTADPQYQNWEWALQDYIARENSAGRTVVLQDPPTELDDSTISTEQIPVVEFVSPVSGAVLNSKQIFAQVKATAPRGISKVYYYLDEKSIGMSATFPFDLNYFAADIHRGEHTLMAQAEDEQGVRGEASIKITLDIPSDPPSADWVDGMILNISKTDFPRTMYLAPYRYEDCKDIKVTLSGNGSSKMIFTFRPQDEKLDENGKINFVWKNFPGAGAYSLKAAATGKDGTTSERVIEVTVK